MNKRIKILSLLGIVTIGVVLAAPVARASDIRSGDTVIIAANEVINDDLYITASSFTLEGTVKGDLVVFANTVQINGIVEGDVAGAAQSIVINGVVKDDVRVAGAAITLGPNGRVGDDFLAASGSVETKPGSTIGGDLSAASSQALLAGDVANNLLYNGANLSLQGHIGGNAAVSVDGSTTLNDNMQPRMYQAFLPAMPAWPVVPAGLTLGNQAVIGGKLDYTSPQPATIPTNIKSEVKYTPMPANSTTAAVIAAPYTVSNWLLDQLRNFVILAGLGALLLWLLPVFTERVTHKLATKPWPSLGWGFIVAIVVPVGAVIVLVLAIIVAGALGLVTLGSLGGALIITTLAAIFSGLVAFGLITAYLTKIVVANWLGQWVLGKLAPKRATSRGMAVLTMLVGLLPVVLLTGIPTIGALFDFVIGLLGLGALWLMWQRTPMSTTTLLPVPTLTTSTAPSLTPAQSPV